MGHVAKDIHNPGFCKPVISISIFLSRGNRAGADCARTGTNRLTSLLECQAYFVRKLKDDHLRYRSLNVKEVI